MQLNCGFWIGWIENLHSLWLRSLMFSMLRNTWQFSTRVVAVSRMDCATTII